MSGLAAGEYYEAMAQNERATVALHTASSPRYAHVRNR